MRRTVYIILAIVVVLAVVVVSYIHFFTPKTEDPNQQIPKATSAVDLRPFIVKKLQQLVKDGSDGLYNLSIEKLEPDVSQASLDVFGAKLTPDSAALKKLDSAQKAPDDIYNISFHALHINGITINDLIHSDHISLDSISVKDPVFEVYHESRSYNKTERKADSASTLYQRLMKQVKSLSVNSIIIKNGKLTGKNANEKNKPKTFDNINASFDHLLIDSSTQFDKNRFLFSKGAELSCRNFLTRTADSLYFFKVGSLTVRATEHKLIARDVALVPRWSKKEFERKLTYLGDRYNLQFPKIILNNSDWWSLANNENFFAGDADVYNAVIKDYIDRSLPAGNSTPSNDFPSQLFLRIPLKINIRKINFHQLKIEYEEYNPEIKKSSGIYFDNVNGTLKNLTNVKPAINKNPHVSFSGSGMFMSKVETRCSFQFDLSKPKTADCSVDLQMGALDKSILNPFTEPLGFFTVKSGEMKTASAHLEGNIYTMHCNILMLYNDLHLTPLKPKSDSSGDLKKKPVTSFIANVFFIKNNNPSKGEAPRNVDVTVQRDHHDHFFNFLWKTFLTGILKTIGVPEKYADKNSGK